MPFESSGICVADCVDVPMTEQNAHCERFPLSTSLVFFSISDLCILFISHYLCNRLTPHLHTSFNLLLSGLLSSSPFIHCLAASLLPESIFSTPYSATFLPFSQQPPLFVSPSHKLSIINLNPSFHSCESPPLVIC